MKKGLKTHTTPQPATRKTANKKNANTNQLPLKNKLKQKNAGKNTMTKTQN